MVKSVLSQEEMLDIDVSVSRVTLSLRRCWETCKNAGRDLCRSKTAVIGALMLLRTVRLVPSDPLYSPL